MIEKTEIYGMGKPKSLIKINEIYGMGKPRWENRNPRVEKTEINSQYCRAVGGRKISVQRAVAG